MKINHRNPSSSWFSIPESSPVDDAYEAEVQQSTSHLEDRIRKARERLARAERKLAGTILKRDAAKLRQLINERREELAELERMMRMAPFANADKRLSFRTGRDDHLELGQ